MCTGAELAWAAVALAGTGASVYNQNQTLRRQDQQAATAIQNQGRVQRQVDNRVDQEVQKLQESTARDERTKALEGYMATLGRNRRALESGLTPTVGSDAFRASSAQAAGDVNSYAARAADLMSRIDAPLMQRQGEAFGYGHLATDINTLARDAQGLNFLDEMRLRAIRRNPYIDAAAGFATSYAGSQLGAGASAGAAPSGSMYATAPTTSGGASWMNAYGGR